MSSPRTYNVLVLCTGNSARSILGEALLNRLGRGRFKAFSAGSHPKGEVHPEALKIVRKLGFDPDDFRSKAWDEFAAPGAPELDFIITVCDNAAGEVCPIWPGRPATSHWGLPDPAAVQGTPEDITRAFEDTARMLGNRIRLFASLPIDKLDRLSLKQRMDEIGATQDAIESA
jgi:arsenate reductase